MYTDYVVVASDVKKTSAIKENMPILKHIARSGDVAIVIEHFSGADRESKGFYTRGVIHLNADKLSEGGYTYTGIHECVHYIAEVNREGYASIEKYVENYYKKKGVDIEAVKKATQKLYEQRGEKLTPEEAMEEIVCNTLSDIATDADALTAFMGLDSKSRNKFIDALNTLARKLKAWAKTHLAGTKYHDVVIKDADTLLSLAKQLNAELAKASQKNNTATFSSDVKYAKVKAEKGMSVDFSLSTEDVNKKSYSFADFVESKLDMKGKKANREYMRAVRKGDVKTQERLVYEAAEREFSESKMRDKSGNLETLYHGTQAFGFTEFDLEKMDDKRSIFLTNSKRIASTYSGIEGERAISTASNESSDKSGNYKVVANAKNPLIIDGNGSLWKSITPKGNLEYTTKDTALVEKDGRYVLLDRNTGEFIPNTERAVDSKTQNMSEDELHRTMVEDINRIRYRIKELKTTRAISRYAQIMGYDGVIFRNIADNGGQNSSVAFDEIADIFIVFDSSQVKSVDAVTYDKNGEVIPLSQRFDSTMGDMRYSFSDENVRKSMPKVERLYYEALENEDMDSADMIVNMVASRAMKDSKIRNEVGLLEKVYHGTEAESFNEFDKQRRGQTDSSMYGRGYYFAFDPDYASDFGDNIREFYLDIKNPYYIDINAPASNIADFLISNGVEVDFDYSNMISHYFAKNFGSQKFTDTLIDLGYDGVVVRTDEGENFEAVAFHRNQMKLADVVTYDDQGEAIPLAERFNMQTRDVRYSFDENLKNKDVFGFVIDENAIVDEALLEEISAYHPEAEVDREGNVTVYHRTTEDAAKKIKETGIMKAKEDALFFSSKESGYATDYGESVVKLKIPSTMLRLNDVFDGEVHFDLPLKYKNGGYSIDVSKYLVNDARSSFDEGGLRYLNHDLQEVLDSFGIVKNNDYIHVQKQVFNTLKSEGFFEDREHNRTVVINSNSGMEIEINRKGINETFNDKNYNRISKDLKYIKLLTIRDIDKIIKTAHLAEDNVSNFHNENNGVKYAYLENVVNVNGTNRVVSVAVRKSIRKNMFWVHQIDIKKDTRSLSARVDHSETDYLTSGVDNNIAHGEVNVNKKSYSFGEEDLDLGFYISEGSGVSESLKDSGRAVGAMLEKTRGAEVDIFDISRVMKNNLKDFGIKGETISANERILEVINLASADSYVDGDGVMVLVLSLQKIKSAHNLNLL